MREMVGPPQLPLTPGPSPGARGESADTGDRKGVRQLPFALLPSPARRGQTGRRVLVIVVSLLVGACQQQMSKQPYYRPLEKSRFFADGRSARPIPAGTVPRNRPLAGSPLASGQAPGYADNVVSADVPPTQRMQFVSEFPFQMTVADLSRGRERFEIFCAACHDPLGTGHGKIVERGYLEPPSYLTDNSRGFERVGIRRSLREVPVGYFFHVITEGFGGMPAYRSQIPPADRWRIAAYIRVLQFSQNVPLGSLPAAEQTQMRHDLERK